MENIIDVWNKASAKERSEFIAGICKRYPSLICEILKKQANCTASVLKEYLYGDK